jgi:hypothetical protein
MIANKKGSPEGCPQKTTVTVIKKSGWHDSPNSNQDSTTNQSYDEKEHYCQDKKLLTTHP